MLRVLNLSIVADYGQWPPKPAFMNSQTNTLYMNIFQNIERLYLV